MRMSLERFLHSIHASEFEEWFFTTRNGDFRLIEDVSVGIEFRLQCIFSRGLYRTCTHRANSVGDPSVGQ